VSVRWRPPLTGWAIQAQANRTPARGSPSPNWNSVGPRSPP